MILVAMTSEMEMTSEVETIMMISWAIPVISWTMTGDIMDDIDDMQEDIENARRVIIEIQYD